MQFKSCSSARLQLEVKTIQLFCLCSFNEIYGSMVVDCKNTKVTTSKLYFQHVSPVPKIKPEQPTRGRFKCKQCKKNKQLII